MSPREVMEKHSLQELLRWAAFFQLEDEARNDAEAKARNKAEVQKKFQAQRGRK